MQTEYRKAEGKRMKSKRVYAGILIQVFNSELALEEEKQELVGLW